MSTLSAHSASSAPVTLVGQGFSRTAFLSQEASMKKKQKTPDELAAEAQCVLRRLRALDLFDQRAVLQAALVLLLSPAGR